MIHFNCPHCGNAIKVKDDIAGKKGKCRGCGETIQVPSDAAATEEETAGLSTRTKKTTAFIIGVCGGFIVPLIIGLLVWFIANRDTWEVDNTSRVLAKLEEADRLQQSDPLAARKTYDEVLNEAKLHKITGELFAKKLADAEDSRTAANQEVQKRTRSKEVERQRRAEEEAHQVAAEKRRLAEEEARRAEARKQQLAKEREEKSASARAKAPRQTNMPKSALKPVAPAIPTMSDEPFALKGDKLGMSLNMFKKRYYRTVRNDPGVLPFCSDEHPNDDNSSLLYRGELAKAGIVHGRINFPFEEYGDPGSFGKPTVAGIPADLYIYKFVDQRLYEIEIVFAQTDFFQVAEALIDKHGRPKRQTRKTYHNTFGAEFDGQILEWENTVSEMTLTERSASLDQSGLILAHKEFQASAMQKIKKYIKPHSDDL